MVRAAAAATEACLSVGVLRRWETLGVSGRGLKRSRRPWRARPGPGPGERQGRKERPPLGAARPGLAAQPQEPQDVRGGKGSLSAAASVTSPSRPSRGRPLGLYLERPRERSTGTPPFPDVSLLLSRKKHLPLVGNPPVTTPMWRKLASRRQNGEKQATI